MSIRSHWVIVLFKSPISLLFFCQVLSIIVLSLKINQKWNLMVFSGLFWALSCAYKWFSRYLGLYGRISKPFIFQSNSLTSFSFQDFGMSIVCHIQQQLAHQPFNIVTGISFTQPLLHPQRLRSLAKQKRSVPLYQSSREVPHPHTRQAQPDKHNSLGIRSAFFPPQLGAHN